MAERLFAARGYANVSVRDIAREAAVTHPLIYYHWRSKSALFADVVGRTQARVRAVAAQGGAAREEVVQLVRESVSGSRTYMLTLARAFLDGMPAEDWPGGFPGVEGALRVLQGESGAVDDDTRRRVALAVGLLFGWVLFEDQLLDIVGMGGSDRAAARRALEQAELAILEPAFARAAGDRPYGTRED